MTRAANVLRLVAEREGRTAAEIAQAIGCPRPTCYHLLNTLNAEGLLSKDPRRRYHLGPLVGALSDALIRELAPPEHIVAGLHRLADSTGVALMYRVSKLTRTCKTLVCFVRGPPPIQPAFDLTGLSQALSFVDDLGELP